MLERCLGALVENLLQLGKRQHVQASPNKGAPVRSIKPAGRRLGSAVWALPRHGIEKPETGGSKILQGGHEDLAKRKQLSLRNGLPLAHAKLLEFGPLDTRSCFVVESELKLQMTPPVSYVLLPVSPSWLQNKIPTGSAFWILCP